MKTTLHRLLVVGLLFGSAIVSQADILLRIDITDPNDILFIPTTNAPYVNDTRDSSVGVTLLNFLTADRNDYRISPLNDLRTSTGMGISDDFDLMQFHNYNAFALPGRDALLMNQYPPGPNTQIFRTDMPAFIGLTHGEDFADIIHQFQEPGYIGDIVVGSVFTPGGPLIGEYQIIPEPSTVVMLMLGALGLGGYATRRRR